MRRAGGVILVVLLLIGVGAAVWIGTGGFGLVGGTTPVSGVIGSEKRAFFEDERVREIFEDNGYEVTIETAGSRQIGTEALDEAAYDFAFPSSSPVAAVIEAERDVIESYDPFFSPMVVATFTPIAELLEANGLATRRGEAWALDMEAYLAAVGEERRWTDLSGNENGEVYPSDRQILITSTDVRTSNSAAMYLSIASYVANGNSVVTTAEQEEAVLPVLTDIFLGQGFSEASSEGPFSDYLTLGLGRAPMVMAYESQYVDRQIRDDGSITDDRVLMYPSPTVLSEHTLLSLTENGDAVGRLIDTEPELQRLLAEYGFRVQSPAVFAEVLQGRNIEVPPDVVDTADTPSYEVLERLITRLEEQYTAEGAAPVETEDATGDEAAATTGTD